MSTVAGLLLIVWCMFEITCWYVHLLNAILSHWCCSWQWILECCSHERSKKETITDDSVTSVLTHTYYELTKIVFFRNSRLPYKSFSCQHLRLFFRVKSSVFPRDFTSMVRSNQGSISRPSGSLVSKDVCYKTSIRRTTTRKPWLAAYCCICWPKALHWYISPTFSTLSSNRRVTEVDQKEIYNFTFLRKESENCCVYAGVNCQGF